MQQKALREANMKSMTDGSPESLAKYRKQAEAEKLRQQKMNKRGT